MKRLKFLFAIPMMFLIVTCSNAQSKGEGEVVLLNKADFLTKVFNYEKQTDEWIYEGKKPCIIDFYADWCGPCKMIAPIMKELAAKYKDDIIFYKIDVDVEKELAGVFGVSSIPLVLYVPMEGPPQASLGARPKEEILEIINSVLFGKDI
jgi:thioredoxin